MLNVELFCYNALIRCFWWSAKTAGICHRRWDALLNLYRRGGLQIMFARTSLTCHTYRGDASRLCLVGFWTSKEGRVAAGVSGVCCQRLLTPARTLRTEASNQSGGPWKTTCRCYISSASPGEMRGAQNCIINTSIVGKLTHPIFHETVITTCLLSWKVQNFTSSFTGRKRTCLDPTNDLGSFTRTQLYVFLFLNGWAHSFKDGFVFSWFFSSLGTLFLLHILLYHALK